MFAKIRNRKYQRVARRSVRLVFIVQLLAGIATTIYLAPPTHAAQPVIDRVQVDVVSGEIGIQIMFNRLLRYVTHSPGTSGKTLVISLRPVLSAAEDAEEFLRRERANLVGEKSNLIEEIRYEGDHPTGPKLEITFTRHVEFLVAGASDLRSIFVFVPQQVRQKKPRPKAMVPSNQRQQSRRAAAKNAKWSGRTSSRR